MRKLIEYANATNTLSKLIRTQLHRHILVIIALVISYVDFAFEVGSEHTAVTHFGRNGSATEILSSCTLLACWRRSSKLSLRQENDSPTLVISRGYVR